MSHGFLDGEEIRTGLIKVQTEGMPQGVQVETAPGEAVLCQMPDKGVVDGLLADMSTVFLSGEQPVFLYGRAVIAADVINEQVKCPVRQNGVPVYINQIRLIRQICLRV